MKIAAIKPFPVWVGHRNQLVVKVETDEGIYGLGEAGLSGRELAVVGALNHYREFLLNRDPMRIGALWQEMYRSQYFEGGRALTAAISAIDIALHDIVGKALGVPVYQLLGGKQRDFVPCFATTGAPTVEKLLENTKLLIDKGWNVIRTTPAHRAHNDGQNIFEPRESIGITADWLTQLREAVGSTPVLGIDYHHRLSVAEAASFCQRMPSGTLDFLEEPIRDETPEAYESLRTMVDVPFAIGEEFSSKWVFLPYLERGITNFARLDVCNVGGLTEAMKVAGLAEAHYIDLMPHNPLGPICTAATIHLAAAVPNFAWLEVRVSPTEASGFYDEEIFPVQPKLEGARFVVPDMPGLGVEFNEELAAKQTFKFWEAPHLRRRDGSYTNW
ncbi:mandelate racemase/muconate lactonizing enzyme family protein [Candidatus Poribacteria bacterium]|nr:mandelate racemase/muconate lactonizing enzyme family protein [Candidatus Poribacteria bacterium]